MGQKNNINKGRQSKKAEAVPTEKVKAVPANNPKGLKGPRSNLHIQAQKKALLEALEQSLGVVTTACRKLGIARDFYYNQIKEDPEFRAKVEELGNVALDFAESHLHKRITEGSDAATIFYLKTKGKGRGYIERTEITGNGGSPIAIQVVTTDTETQRALEEL
jgi:hypothetical protein